VGLKNEKVWLMNGDCLGRMKEIPDGSVDMLHADLARETERLIERIESAK